MRFLTDPKIDFMGMRKGFIVLSVVLVLSSLSYLVYAYSNDELNVGIDFAGGTQITLQFGDTPDIDQLRTILNDAGIAKPQIQRFGLAERNELLIRTATVEGSEEGASDALFAALDGAYNPGSGAGDDLNRMGPDAVARLLTASNPLGLDLIPGAVPDEYRQIGEAVIAQRRDVGLLASWDDLANIDGMSPEKLTALQDSTHLGAFSLLSVENVGPQIGSELKSKGIWAVVFSLVGMLAYIAFRFQLRFGIGAVVAIFHDVLITLGIYAFLGFEFNLTLIAAFLTLVGYSVNDTVVVFDRVRENMQRLRREPLVETLNKSLNQTLSRTVMTSMTTFLVVLTLFVFGGQVIRGFAFVLTAGVVVGTYSSVFVASPVVLAWEARFSKEARTRRRESK